MKMNAAVYILCVVAMLTAADANAQLQYYQYCINLQTGPMLQLEQIVTASSNAARGEMDAEIACGLWKQALEAEQQIIVYENQCNNPAAAISSASIARSFAREVERACNSGE